MPTPTEQERRIAACREQRWTAVMAVFDSETAEGLDDFISSDEAYDAVMSARADLLDLPPG